MLTNNIEITEKDIIIMKHPMCQCQQIFIVNTANYQDFMQLIKIKENFRWAKFFVFVCCEHQVEIAKYCIKDVIMVCNEMANKKDSLRYLDIPQLNIPENRSIH